jgi:putative chitinase
MRVTDLSESKSTKSVANYQSNPHAGQRCVNCTMWRDPNKCSAVAGNISPDGWCDYWAPGAYGKHGKSIDESEILDEGWRENLYKLVTIGALGLTAAAAITTKNEYDRWAATHPQTMQALDNSKSTTQQVTTPSTALPKAPTTPELPKAGVQDQSPKSNLAPTKSLKPQMRPQPPAEKPLDNIRPSPRPSLDTLGPLSKTLHDAAVEAGITGTELIALMAQSAHETGMFNDLHEQGQKSYFDKYEPGTYGGKILGNTEVGDGWKYRGRGYLHVTGRYNYQAAQEDLGYDFINNPELIADPDIAAETAIWFWKKRVRPKVTDFDDVKSVTYPINSQFNGLADRRSKYKEISKLVKRYNIDLDESVTETIRKISDNQWRLYSKDGKKNLGTFGSLEAAKKHEREVQYFKHTESMQYAEDIDGRIVINVDVAAIHAASLREHLLSDSKLYENLDDYQDMRQFLNLHKTAVPIIGQEYVYASVHAIPISKYANIAYFDTQHELIKIDNNFAYFDIDGVIKRFPETGTLDGDALSQIYFFNSIKEYQHFIMLLELKFSEYKQTYKMLDETAVSENFKDGKKPGRKGLAKRSGVDTKASVSSLRKTAKNSTGEKQRMAHWLANMKAGRQKAAESHEQPRYTASEWAIMEGGHVLEEQPKDKLFGWLLNTDKDI